MHAPFHRHHPGVWTQALHWMSKIADNGTKKQSSGDALLYNQIIGWFLLQTGVWDQLSLACFYFNHTKWHLIALVEPRDGPCGAHPLILCFMLGNLEHHLMIFWQLKYFNVLAEHHMLGCHSFLIWQPCLFIGLQYINAGVKLMEFKKEFPSFPVYIRG